MRKPPLFALLTLLAAGANAQSADMEPKLSFEIQGGMSQLLGDGSEYFENAFSIGLTALSSPARQAQFGLSVNYNRFGVKTEDILSDAGLQLPSGASIEQTFSIVEVAPVLRISLIPPDQKFVPFIQGGMGMYFTTANTESSYMGRSNSDTQSDNYFGINLSGGFRAQLSERAGLLLAPSYHIIFSDDDEMESSKYFSIRGGLSFAL